MLSPMKAHCSRKCKQICSYFLSIGRTIKEEAVCMLFNLGKFFHFLIENFTLDSASYLPSFNTHNVSSATTDVYHNWRFISKYPGIFKRVNCFTIVSSPSQIKPDGLAVFIIFVFVSLVHFLKIDIKQYI